MAALGNEQTRETIDAVFGRIEAASGERYEAIRDEAIELQGHVLEQLPEGDLEKFLEQLEIVAQACRDVSNPQR